MMRVAFVVISFSIVFQTFGQVFPAKKGSWGLVDQSGNWVVEPIYDTVFAESEHLAVAISKTTAVYIDGKSNKFSVTLAYPENNSYRYGSSQYFIQSKIRNRSDMGYLLKAGLLYWHNELFLPSKLNLEIVELESYNADYSNYHPGFSKATMIKRMVIKHSSKYAENEYGPAQFYLIDSNNYLVRTQNKYGLINANEKWVIPPKYQQLWYLPSSQVPLKVESENLHAHKQIDNCSIFPFQSGNKWGFMNREGVEVIEPKYLAVSFFSSGKAAIATESGFGYIDTNDQWIIEPQYDIAYDFKGEIAPIFTNGKYVLLHQQGYVLVDSLQAKPIFKNPVFHFTTYNSEACVVTKDGKVFNSNQEDLKCSWYNNTMVVQVHGQIFLLPNSEWEKRKVIKKAHASKDGVLIVEVEGATFGVFDTYQSMWLIDAHYDRIDFNMSFFEDVVPEFVEFVDRRLEPLLWGQNAPLWLCTNNYIGRGYLDEIMIVEKRGKHFLFDLTRNKEVPLPKSIPFKPTDAVWYPYRDGKYVAEDERGRVFELDSKK